METEARGFLALGSTAGKWGSWVLTIGLLYLSAFPERHEFTARWVDSGAQNHPPGTRRGLKSPSLNSERLLWWRTQALPVSPGFASNDFLSACDQASRAAESTSFSFFSLTYFPIVLFLDFFFLPKFPTHPTGPCLSFLSNVTSQFSSRPLTYTWVNWKRWPSLTPACIVVFPGLRQLSSIRFREWALGFDTLSLNPGSALRGCVVLAFAWTSKDWARM